MRQTIYVIFTDENSDIDFQEIRAGHPDEAIDTFISKPSNVDYIILEVTDKYPTIGKLLKAS